MAKKRKSLAEQLYGQTTPKPKERKGEPDKRTPAERLGKLVPIFGRIGDALSGKKKKEKKR